MSLLWVDPRRVWSEVRRHLAVIDVVIAVALTVGALDEINNLHFRGEVPLAAFACMFWTGAVALRRFAPRVAMVLVVTSIATYESGTQDRTGAFVAAALVLVAYIFGRSVLENDRLVHGVLILAYALAAFEIVAIFWHKSSPTGIVGTWLTDVVAPTVVGVMVERRDQVNRQLSAVVEQLCEEQRIRGERAVAEERNRVARELHDVVVHHLSVMAIQAAAARTVAHRVDAATSALRTVTESGREALTELRRITGVLRRNDVQWAGHPPRLDQLDMLVARTRAAGVMAELKIVGDLHVVPLGIDLAAYRIIQEALTNVVKHAATTSASVSLTINRDTLNLSVINDGVDDTKSRLRLPPSGQGLVGMRERVDLYCGHLQAGPRPNGGYQVRATIPFGAPNPSTPQRVDTAVAKTPTHRMDWGAIRQHSDVLLAGAWLVALEFEAFTSTYRRGPLALNVFVVGAMAIAGRWRRRAPLLFLAAVGALALLLDGGLDTLQSATTTGTYLVVVPLYTMAVWEDSRRAVVGLVVWESYVIGFGSIMHASGGATGAGMMGGIIWVAGRIWRNYRQLHNELITTINRLESESSEKEQLVIANQRALIAKDLDHLVVHHVIEMIIQAQAAQSDRTPETIRSKANVIEDTGRQALAQMRDILGVLRVHGMPPDLVPWPNRASATASDRAFRPLEFVALKREVR